MRHSLALAASGGRRLFALGALVTLMLLGTAAPAQAALHTWVGGGGNALWSNAANWSGGVPTSGEAGGTFVQFGSGAVSDMDIPALTITQLVFSAGGSTVTSSSGLALRIAPSFGVIGIVSAGTGNKISPSPTPSNGADPKLSLLLDGSTEVEVRSSAGQFAINGPITGSAPIRFTTNSTGTGTKLTGSSTFTGPVIVQSGELLLDNSDINAAVTGSSLQIGTVSGGGASVKLAQALEIANTTAVTVKSDGTLDLQGAQDAIGDLTVDGGAVVNLPTATPSLTVGGTLTVAGGTIGSGGALAVTGDVSGTAKSGDAATILAPLRLTTGTIDVPAGGAPGESDLVLGGPVSQSTVASMPLTKTGNGILVMAAGAPSTYAGATVVQDGRLNLTGSAAQLPATALQVGDGTGSPQSASVVTEAAANIPAGADVDVRTDGRLDLTATGGSIDALSVTGSGEVVLASRTLTLGGTLTMTGGTISGTAPGKLALGGNVTATSAASGGPGPPISATITAPLELGGARTFTVNDGPAATDAKLENAITDGGAGAGSLRKAGLGTLLLAGTGNLHTGGTTVTEGVLETNASVTAAIPPGGLTIGDGSGAARSATVRNLAPADIASDVTINSDGLLDTNGFGQAMRAVTINDGAVRAANQTFVDTLTMNGGVVEDGGTAEQPGALTMTDTPGVTPSISLQPGAAGPPSLAYPGDTFANGVAALTVTVAPGLDVTTAGGFVTQQSLVKAGAGTLRVGAAGGPPASIQTGTNPVLGAGAKLDVQGGTLVGPTGSTSGATTVGPLATLQARGPVSVGDTLTVSGTLRPAAPNIATGTLSFGTTSRLKVAVSSTAPAGIPSVAVTGTATIASGASLDLSTADGLAIPVGLALPLLTNDAADAITGSFANAPAGGSLGLANGAIFGANYAAGDGNDLVLTSTQASAPPATPTPAPVSTPTPTPTPTAPPEPSPVASPGPAPQPSAKLTDSAAPVVTFAAAKRQRFRRAGTVTVQLRSNEAATATVIVSIKPAGARRALKSATIVTLPAGQAVAAPVTIPSGARAAITKALKAKKAARVTITASVRDAAGNAVAPKPLRVALAR